MNLNMKKLAVILLAAVLALVGFVGCGQKSGAKLEGSLNDILTQIYTNVDVDDDTRTWLQNYMNNQEITAENCSYFLGTDVAFEEGLASEPMMSSQAYSLCLIRVADDADIDQIKKDIRDNVNPMKWICVSVDDENIVVDNIGNVIILIMSELSEPLHTAFTALAK